MFWKVKGLTVPQANFIQTRAPGQSGYTLHGVTLENREVTLYAHADGRHDGTLKKMYELRRDIQAALNPLLGTGILTYENDGGKWQTYAALSNADDDQWARVGIQTLIVKLECPSPFWLDSNETAVKLAYIGGGLRFPFRVPCHCGVMGYRAQIFNDSNTEVPFELTIVD